MQDSTRLTALYPPNLGLILSISHVNSPELGTDKVRQLGCNVVLVSVNTVNGMLSILLSRWVTASSRSS